MAAIRPSWIVKSSKFQLPVFSLEGQCVSLCQILRQSVKPLRRCGEFFKMAAVRHLGLMKVLHFNFWYTLEDQCAS